MRCLVRRFVSCWPLLESFTIRGHRIESTQRQSRLTSNLLSASTNLRALTLGLVNAHDSGVASVLTGAPASLTTITLDFNVAASGVSLTTPLRVVESQLEHLRILTFSHARLDEFVPRLTRVRKLTVTIGAVGRWLDTLAPLTVLVELNLIQSKGGVEYRPLPVRDLTRAISALDSLARLSFESGLWQQWDRKGQAALEESARRRDVTLTIA